MNNKLLIFVLSLLVSTIANSQTIYTCIKDGKKSISDKPCQIGANEQKRLQSSSDYNPSKTDNANIQIYRDEPTSSKYIEKQQVPPKTASSHQEISNRYTCDRLSNTRNGILDAQRRNSTPALASQLHDIDAEMFSNACHKVSKTNMHTEQDKQITPSKSDYEKKEAARKSLCSSLSSSRDYVIESQRKNSTPALANNLKNIDDKMFSNDCHK